MNRDTQTAIDIFIGHVMAMSEGHVKSCEVCGKATIGQVCLQEHVKQVVAEKRGNVPSELRAALKVLKGADKYRITDKKIPDDRIAKTLQALQVVEQNKVATQKHGT